MWAVTALTRPNQYARLWIKSNALSASQYDSDAVGVAGVHCKELAHEAGLLTHLQVRPFQMRDALVDYLRHQRVEIPTYSLLREIIARALNDFDAHLQTLKPI